MLHGSLFSGYGGLDIAVSHVFNASTAWVSDIEPAPQRVLAYRYPHAPNLGDITRVDWGKVTPVDIMSGGSPCQDLSIGSSTRAGMFNGTRSGLWESMRAGIDVIKPGVVIWENVKGAYSAKSEYRGQPITALGRVVSDLADMGYISAWGVVRASDTGLPHRRERVFVLATTHPDSLQAGFGFRGGELVPTGTAVETQESPPLL